MEKASAFQKLLIDRYRLMQAFIFGPRALSSVQYTQIGAKYI
jgi:hypothetical protein